MQREEFESLTGFRPTLSMYSVIEQFYMESKQDKAEFCREYVQNIDGIAVKIQWIADKMEINQKQAFENRIAKLLEQIDKEMFEVCQTVSDETVVKILSVSFGLMPEKIRIRNEVQEFERNKYGNYRVKRTFQRKPVYENCECNYIRFDCAGRQWELVNGELISYDRLK